MEESGKVVISNWCCLKIDLQDKWERERKRKSRIKETTENTIGIPNSLRSCSPICFSAAMSTYRMDQTFQLLVEITQGKEFHILENILFFSWWTLPAHAKKKSKMQRKAQGIFTKKRLKKKSHPTVLFYFHSFS